MEFQYAWPATDDGECCPATRCRQSFCVRSGHAQFKKLLELFPDRYAAHEAKEEELRKIIGKDVSIMKDRRNKTTKPMTMKQFRERLVEEENKLDDEDDWGGCGCFVDNEGTEKQ